MLASTTRINSMARELADKFEKHAWCLTPAIRSAMVAEAVLGIVTGQDSSIKVSPEDVYNLQNGVRERLCAILNNETLFDS